MGGTETEWEATYGRVRYLTPQEVKDVTSALEKLSTENLRRRFEPDTFRAAGLYPHNVEWDTEGLEYLLDMFTKVRDFFTEAAREGDVVLLSSD